MSALRNLCAALEPLANIPIERFYKSSPDRQVIHVWGMWGSENEHRITVGDVRRARAALDEARVNAHLIAAAPDLYNTLQAAFHALRSYQYENTATEPAARMADECERVLAKARGEQP